MTSVFHVGAGQAYADIQSAVADIALLPTPPSALDRVVVAVHPGHYDSTAAGTIDLPAYTSVSAVIASHDATTVVNDTAPLFRCVGPYVGIHGLTFHLPAATDQYAILGNNQSRIRIESCKAWCTSLSKKGRFFKQTGPSWINAAIIDTVINAATTDRGGLALDEGVVSFENTSGSRRNTDVWLQRNFWDALEFTGASNYVTAFYSCDNTRVSHTEMRTLLTGRCALVTLQSHVRFNHCLLEGGDGSIYTGSGGGASKSYVYHCSKGATGGPLVGGGTVIQPFPGL